MNRFFIRLMNDAIYFEAEAVRFHPHGDRLLAQIVTSGSCRKEIPVPSRWGPLFRKWLLNHSVSAGSGRVGVRGHVIAFEWRDGDTITIERPVSVSLGSELEFLALSDHSKQLLLDTIVRSPGNILVVGGDDSWRQRATLRLSAIAGGVGVLLSDEGAVEALRSPAPVPIFFSSAATSIRDALAAVAAAGVPLSDLQIRGVLLHGSSGVSYELFLPPRTPRSGAVARPVGASGGASCSVAANQPCVLLVEDDPDQREILILMLKGEGYDVVSAAHGVEALELMKQRLPDLIISDLMMPFLDGRQLLKAVRRDERLQAIPVLILTVIDDDLRELELLKLGARDYCVKTSRPQLLLERIRRWLGQPREPLTQ